MDDRQERVESYYQESAWDLADALVSAEDEIAFLKAEIARLRNGDQV